MLSFSPGAITALRAGARPAFLERVRRRLVATFPHFLPCFPDEVQARITGHMLERAAGWGLTHQASLWAFCELMVSVTPNFDEEPAIHARLSQLRDELDGSLAELGRTMPPHVRRSAQRSGSRMPLFVPHRLVAAPAPDRVAAAIVTALHDRAEAAAAPAAAARAVAEADRLGLTQDDAPLVVAACQSFWSPAFTRMHWAEALWREPWSAAERVELLRFRLAAAHRRFV